MKEEAKLMINKNETIERSLCLFYKRVLNYYTSSFFLCKSVLQAPTKPIESSTKHPQTKWWTKQIHFTLFIVVILWSHSCPLDIEVSSQPSCNHGDIMLSRELDTPLPHSMPHAQRPMPFVGSMNMTLHKIFCQNIYLETHSVWAFILCPNPFVV